MKRKSQGMKRRATTKPHDELGRLIEAAQERPGVREAVEVYQHYRKVEEATRSYNQLARIRRVVSLSDASSSIVGAE